MKIVEIVQPSGQLDSNNLSLLHNEIVFFLTRGVKLILIDFQDVIDIHHESVNILRKIFKYVCDRGGKFYICSLNEQVKNTFKITNAENLFKPLKNRQEFEDTILVFNAEEP